MNIKVLSQLEDWYLAQCDGDWEHEFGVKIDTLDNPGWSIEIDLVYTNMSDKKFNTIDQQISENNWVQCKVQDGKFHGAGGPKNLTEILKIFLGWVEKKEILREIP